MKKKWEHCHAYKSWWDYVCIKPISRNILVLKLLNRPAPTVFELQGPYFNKRSVMKCYTEVFQKKITTSGNWKCLWKTDFYRTHNNSRTKMNYEKKTLSTFVEQTIYLQLIFKSTMKVQLFIRNSNFRGLPFSRFMWITSFLWGKLEKKSTRQLPQIFFIFTCIQEFSLWLNKQWREKSASMVTLRGLTHFKTRFLLLNLQIRNFTHEWYPCYNSTKYSYGREVIFPTQNIINFFMFGMSKKIEISKTKLKKHLWCSEHCFRFLMTPVLYPWVAHSWRTSNFKRPLRNAVPT